MNLERRLLASVVATAPRPVPVDVRLRYYEAAAARFLPADVARIFAASVLAPVRLGCDVREAVRSVIDAWRIARRGGGAMWPEHVGAVAVEEAFAQAESVLE